MEIKLPAAPASFAETGKFGMPALADSAEFRLFFLAWSVLHAVRCSMEFVMASIESALSVYSQAMNLRTQRHQVLASNIANADTPNYKARDFSFEKAMQSAMAGHVSGGITLATTSGNHLKGDGGGAQVALQYRSPSQSAVDGNTVDMDVERSQITENSVQYQILTQLISEKIKGVRSALASTSA